MRARLVTTALAAAASTTLVVSCQSKGDAVGQLMVSIQSDMSIPDDVDVVGIRVASLGQVLHATEHHVGKGEVLIPATLNILGGDDPARPVTIQVWARLGSHVRTLRQVVTTVPADRVAALRMPIQWLCTGTAEEAEDCPENDYCIATTCSDGQSCVAGECVPDDVDSEALPDFRGEDVFGGADKPGASGKCLDAVPCFADGSATTVDPADCSIAAPSGGRGVNVALVLPPGFGGICTPEACLVPLDAESDAGWRTAGDRILLPASVCTKLDNREIAGVATTTSCETKTESMPPCGPWSSVTSEPGSFDEPPPGDVVFPDAGVVQDCTGIADGTLCGDQSDTDCDHADTCQEGVCAENVQPEGSPCGDTADTTCSAADTCDGAGACLANDAADGVVCDDCAAGPGSCSTCSGGSCTSVCSTGTVAPSQVQITALDGSTYAIDATEVTKAQYCEFLAAEVPLPSESGTRPECAWNDTFVPGGGWPAPGEEDHPVAFVDWCDAVAYCEWRGQRLCGAVGGGANGFADFADPARSQWQNACSNGGTQAYPFGDIYDGAACNGQDFGAGATQAVRSAALCEGGFSGVFDLSGNVFEWEDSCSGAAGPTDGCRLRGGSYLNPGANLMCDADGQGARENQTATVGFRCCD